MRRVAGQNDHDPWDGDARDPLARVLATPLAGGSTPGATVAPLAQPVSTELEQLLVRLAKRAQWGGDGRRGTARIELEAGAWQGAIVTVHALPSREVSVEIELPAGSAAEVWGDRIKSRLEQRGFSVSAVSIH